MGVGESLKFIGTTIMFLMTIFVMYTLFSRIKTDKVETVQDALDGAKLGVSKHVVVSLSLDMNVETYVCSGDCKSKNIKITDESEQSLKAGQLYSVLAEKCEEFICVTITEGGNTG